MIDKNQKVLLELLKASLFGVVPQIPADVDWDAVFSEAKAQTVVALAAKAVPYELAKIWKNAALQNQAHFVRMLHDQDEVVRLFAEHEIPFVILKGTAAAIYYPEPSLRAMGDIDLLVQKDCFERAVDLLNAEGYRQGHSIARHIEFFKAGTEYELHDHYELSNKLSKPSPFEDQFQSEMNSVYGTWFPMLSVNENGLVLLSHAAHHLREGRLGLRHVVDWMMYVHHHLNDEVWFGEFRDLVREYGLETFAITLTFLCHEWLGLPDPITWDQNANRKIAEELLDSVLAHGNFGRKKGNAQRVETVSANIQRRGLFRSLQSSGMTHWKAAKKYRFLRPFAWSYGLWRWFRKGSVKPMDTMKELNDGKKLYRLTESLGI